MRRLGALAADGQVRYQKTLLRSGLSARLAYQACYGQVAQICQVAQVAQVAQTSISCLFQAGQRTTAGGRWKLVAISTGNCYRLYQVLREKLVFPVLALNQVEETCL